MQRCVRQLPAARKGVGKQKPACPVLLSFIGINCGSRVSGARGRTEFSLLSPASYPLQLPSSSSRQASRMSLH